MKGLAAYITPFKNNHQRIINNQSVDDIIVGILQTHKQYAHDYDKIAKYFSAPTPYKTGSKIWHYLKSNVHYNIEPDSKQTLRSPAAILSMGANKNIGADCKSYALFSGGILDALNRAGKKIKWCYRFASYSLLSTTPHHVFTVINPGTNNEIWIDPVLESYNNHKPYYHKIDRMALYSVSGIGRRPKKSKAERKAAIIKKLKNRKKLLLKWNPATAPARNSFLAIVKLNLFGIAKKLQALIIRDKSKLQDFWEKLGGSYKSLEKSILVGSKHGKHGKAVGVLPAAIAAAVVSATPIIMKVVKILKDAGIDTKQLEAKGKEVIKKVINKKIDKAVSEGREDITEPTEEVSSSGNFTAMDEPTPTDNSEAVTTNGEEPSEEGETMEGIKDNIIPMLLGLGIGLLTAKFL